MTKEQSCLDLTLPNPDFETVLSFQEFSQELKNNFSWLRDHRQIFYDMIKLNIGDGVDEHPEDPENVGFVKYNTEILFEKGFQHPFVSDRLFINRLARAAETIKSGKEPNRGLIFVGPTGAGKSRFLENILRRYEDYVNCQNGYLNGLRYFAHWTIDIDSLGLGEEDHSKKRWFSTKYLQYQRGSAESLKTVGRGDIMKIRKIEVPCPNRCNPVLIVPRKNGIRENFLKEVFKGEDEIIHKLFHTPEYSWVINSQACPICSSLRYFLWQHQENLRKVLENLSAKAVKFDRRLGEGISLYNPGDPQNKEEVIKDPILQFELDYLTGRSGQIPYVFSSLAKVSGGIYALMDIKQANQERLEVLHNVISEGVHRVEDVEERVNTLIIGVTNPEDLVFIQKKTSLLERFEFVKMPYCLEPTAEVKILESHLEKNDFKQCLPLIPEFFARAIISTRMLGLWIKKNNKTKETKNKQPVWDWLGNKKDEYDYLCDQDMMLLKMEIYSGVIPDWLFERDRKDLTARMRRLLLAYSEEEGSRGISGRDSIVIFHLFVDKYGKNNRLITIEDLITFFGNLKDNVKGKLNGELGEPIDKAFLESLHDYYNYHVLAQVRDSLFRFNAEETKNLVLHYLYSVPKEFGTKEICPWTGHMIEVTEESFRFFQNMVNGNEMTVKEHKAFRERSLKTFNTQTRNEVVGPNALPIDQTKQFEFLHQAYLSTAKEKVLSPFLENKKFRQAVIDFGKDSFKTHDNRIKEYVSEMFKSMQSKHHYSTEGARTIVLHVADQNLEGIFSEYERYQKDNTGSEPRNPLGLNLKP